MVGAYRVRVRNNRNRYDFTVKRNITVLLGDSGTGKTTLYEMIRDYNRYGKRSNVHISCDKNVIALIDDDWQSRLDKIRNSIIIIDEGEDYILSNEFARAVRGSDNYFILETRTYIPALPYSVDEIYELTGEMNKKFKNVYTCSDRMFDNPTKRVLPFRPEVIITEDSKSGFQFFRSEAERLGIQCVSAEGKTKIYHLLKEYSDKDVVIIADGAAFGAEIGNVVKQQKRLPNKVAIFLPESFEWLILNSGVVRIEAEQLEHPENYADSQKYMSWEQYFTDVLREATMQTEYMRYRKDQLAEYYMQEGNAKQIRNSIKGINFDSHADFE